MTKICRYVLFFILISFAEENLHTITEDEVYDNNLISNGDFEELSDENKLLPAYWICSKQDIYSLDSNIYKTGVKSLLLTSKYPKDEYISCKIPVLKPETEYSLVLWTRQNGLMPGEKGGEIKMAWYCTSGKKMDSIKSLYNDFDWKKIVINVKTPPDLQTAVIYILKYTAGSRLWIDSIAIAEGIIDNPGKKDSIINEKAVIENNLIYNGNFEIVSKSNELMPAGWHTSKPDLFSLDSVKKKDGKKSLKLLGKYPRDQYISSAKIIVEPAKIYSFIIWARQDNILQGGNGGSISVSWYCKSGKIIKPTIEFISPFEWEKRVFTLRTPEDVIYGTLSAVKNGKTGVLWLDGIAVAEGVLKQEQSEITESDLVFRMLSYNVMRQSLEEFMSINKKCITENYYKAGKDLINEIKAFEIKADKEIKAKDIKDYKSFQEEILYSESGKKTGDYCLSPYNYYYSEWEPLNTRVVRFKSSLSNYIESEYKNILLNQIKTVSGKGAHYGTGVCESIYKVATDRTYKGNLAKNASISLARNEYEAFQVVVIAHKKELSDVYLTSSDFSDNRGNVVKNKNLKISPVGYVFCNDPEYAVEYKGYWPDPLLPSGSKVSVKIHHNQPFWVRIYAPMETPPGTYKGHLTISARGCPDTSIDTSIEIWNFTLPKKGQFQFPTRFNYNQLLEYYNLRELSFEMELEWCLFILEYRASPTEWYTTRMQPTGEILKKCIEKGMNSIYVQEVSRYLLDRESWSYPTNLTKEKKIEISGALKADMAELDKYGAGDLAIVNGFDEIHDYNVFPFINETFSFVKSIDKRIKTFTTTTYSPIDQLISSVDIFVPLLGHPGSEIMKKKTQKSKVFFYFFGKPNRPFANPGFVDKPALDSRIIFWMAYEKMWTGMSQWGLNIWEANKPKDSALLWPKTEWKPYCKEQFKRRNGEGYLIYPGPDKKPLASIRLENIRDGIEDYEMILMLKSLLKNNPNNDSSAYTEAQSAIDLIKVLAPETWDYDHEAGNLLALRMRIAHALESLQK